MQLTTATTADAESLCQDEPPPPVLGPVLAGIADPVASTVASEPPS
jgi:hypothetical protein